MVFGYFGACFEACIPLDRHVAYHTRILHCMQTLVMLIIIPLPLFFAQTVYGVGGLTAWVVIGMIWAFCSAIAVVLYPLYESRQALIMIARGITKVGPSIAI